MRRSHIRCNDRLDTDSRLTPRPQDAKVLLRQASDDSLNPIFRQVCPVYRLFSDRILVHPGVLAPWRELPNGVA